MYKPVIGNLRAAGQIVSCMIHNCLILIRNRKVKKKNRIHLPKVSWDQEVYGCTQSSISV